MAKKASSALVAQSGLTPALAARFAPKLNKSVAAALGTSLWPYIGTRGASFKLGERKIGNVMDLVILDFVLVNQYYGGEFNPQQSTPPVCFAISTSKAEDAREKMAPPAELATKVSGSCAVCPNNAWGSGKRRGKACKNGARLIVLGSGEDYNKTQGARLSVPVTSVRKLGEYLKGQEERGRPCDGVVTEVTLTAGSDGGFNMDFAWKADINDMAILDALEARAKLGHDSLVIAPSTEAFSDAPKQGGKHRAQLRKVIKK